MNQVFIEVSVCDMGLELSNSDALFKQTTQIEDVSNTGSIGLFICKQMCETTGGSINYDYSRMIGNKLTFLMKIKLNPSEESSMPRADFLTLQDILGA